MNHPIIRTFLHEPTSTFSYVVWDLESRRAAVIDSVLDYDASAGVITQASASRLLDYVSGEGLHVDWILETHAHADHLSGGGYLRDRIGGALGIGEGITQVQRHFGPIFHFEPEFRPDGSQFDRLFSDFARFRVGTIEGQVIPTPGHTSDSVTYVIGDAAFVGDSLFMPDGGTARCDFPGGSARTLYRSVKRLFRLPEETRVFVLHDYRAGGREYRNESTIGEQRRSNIHVRDGIREDDFVQQRETRDHTLGMPALVIPSVQANIRGGHPPPIEANGTRYFRVPLNQPGAFSRHAPE